MKILVASLFAIALTGCATVPAVRAPNLPPLPASVAAPCPAIPLLADNSIAALVTADAALASEYARCQAKHAAAVKAYEAARNGGVKPPKKGKK